LLNSALAVASMARNSGDYYFEAETPEDDPYRIANGGGKDWLFCGLLRCSYATTPTLTFAGGYPSPQYVWYAEVPADECLQLFHLAEEAGEEPLPGSGVQLKGGSVNEWLPGEDLHSGDPVLRYGIRIDFATGLVTISDRAGAPVDSFVVPEFIGATLLPFVGNPTPTGFGPTFARLLVYASEIVHLPAGSNPWLDTP
jgi:hypothetical protein